MKRSFAAISAALILFNWIADATGQGVQVEEPIGILLAAGDIAKCGNEPRHLMDEATAAKLAEQVKDADRKKIPIHVLALGDLAYDHGSPENFRCFDHSWGALNNLTLDNTNVDGLLLPVPGNHEYEQPGPARPYYDYFVSKRNPWVFQQEKHQKKQKSNNKGYYALKFPHPTNGPWHLFALNSELNGQAMKDQSRWLDEQLKTSDAACVLAFWHRPLFSSGPHGHGDCGKVRGQPCRKPNAPLCHPDQNAPYCRSLKRMKEAYTILYKHGASVVLTGHEHNFEQFKRLSPDAKEDPKGIRSFVIGTGGGSLYQDPYRMRWTDVHEVYSHTSFGVLRLDLFSSWYRWTFLPIENNAPISLEVNGVRIAKDTCLTRS